MTTNLHNDERDRSYGLRRLIADLLGIEQGHDFTVPAGTVHLTARRDVRGEAGTVQAGDRVALVSTSNAGFRGIEAAVSTVSGRTIYGFSLGAFDVAD